MKLKGGYNILLSGRPSRAVAELPEPDVLYLPLRSRRFAFPKLIVEDGERVEAGQPLAEDPENHVIPLLAPRAGTVGLNTLEDHIILKDLGKLDEQRNRRASTSRIGTNAPEGADAGAVRRQRR